MRHKTKTKRLPTSFVDKITPRQPTISMDEMLAVYSAEKSIGHLGDAIQKIYGEESERVEIAIRQTMIEIEIPNPRDCSTVRERIICLQATSNFCDGARVKVLDGELSIEQAEKSTTRISIDEIEPEDIVIVPYLVRGFDSRERDISAEWIVGLCQARGEGWEKFTQGDIERHRGLQGYKDFRFHDLTLTKYGIMKSKSHFHILYNFIIRCWIASRSPGRYNVHL